MLPAKIYCIDGHTAGNPIRLIVGGLPLTPIGSLRDMETAFETDLDPVRKSLVEEPRGSAQMVVAALGPSSDPNCDCAVLFLDALGSMPMCIHGTIGVTTFAIDNGIVAPKRTGRIVFDTQAGVVVAEYSTKNGRVDEVSVINVGSFVLEKAIHLNLSGLGVVSVDVVFGGSFYAIVEPQGSYLGLDSLTHWEIIQLSKQLRIEVNRVRVFVHPDNPSITGVRHVMWTDDPSHRIAHGRNVVFYGAEGLDRSPCGTGTSARLAQLYDRGEIGIGDEFIHESIIGTFFRSVIVEEREMETRSAVITKITGSAFVTALNTLHFEHNDPLRTGFRL